MSRCRSKFSCCCFCKKELGIPFIASLHVNFIENILKNAKSLKERVSIFSFLTLQKIFFKKADYVLPVYESIAPYLKTLGIKNYTIAYNVLNPKFIQEKKNYSLNKKIKLISVGRQFLTKTRKILFMPLKRGLT